MRLPDGLYRHLYERFHEKKFPWETTGDEKSEDEDGLDFEASASTGIEMPVYPEKVSPTLKI